jgi:predicted metal-dependent TIM-barrel fold hydrolase
MGELGYDEQTPLEDKALRTQIELAKEFALPIMIHTPHRDKRARALRTMDVLKEHKLIRALRDRPNNEETIREVRPWLLCADLPADQDGQRTHGGAGRELRP